MAHSIVKNTPHKLRVLCLHGMYQNAELFATKTKHLRHDHHAIEYVYVDAPFTIVPRILKQSSQAKHRAVRCTKKKDEFRAWWRPSSSSSPETTTSLMQSDEDRSVLLDFLEKQLRQIGHVDGVLGFSQGASLAAWLCTHQAQRELEWSPRMAVIIGGYLGPPQYSLESGIVPEIKSLHLYGANDHVISAAKSERVVDVFQKAQKQHVLAFAHNQGHVVPKCEDLVHQFHSFMSLSHPSSIASKSSTSSSSQDTRLSPSSAAAQDHVVHHVQHQPQAVPATSLVYV